ncbi:TraB/GumN family protein [Ulvibacterium marinum]|uniref:TraB/GumN family protein n=1 Tax=Ulvibacterium marinum TaxID=2419782 RepID=A0A3B0C8U7_9FLAO|nr:TraB/GumN family protein [Ulvibacterium marinum]RKN82645.1 TraB/GumN family protein [Ulvibacterium marinum]
MRFFFAFLVGISSFSIFPQEENSLLWEISGNGLEQSSYLYGTMHVSKRIAFRLDDVFYQALDKSEVVALESDPDTWLEADENIGFTATGQGSSFNPKGFYRYPFTIRNPRKEEIAGYLAFEDQRVNNILYRTNAYSQNFEEETYLDMFIYQTGKKFDKKVIALENLEESTALVGRASLNVMKQKPDEWLQKKMQQQDPMTLLQDAYRNRNINLLDSLDKAMYTDHYLKNMLFIRNRNMAQELDSVMRRAKVFTGIGAAHLPGRQGVIAMLREMGYTVRPLTSRSTAKGRRLKEKFEKSIKENEYATFSPDDNFFSLVLPNKLYPIAGYVNTTYISPDLANGSYVMVNRIPTFSHLKQDAIYTLEDLDKLLFENIPGKILEKTRINRNGFQGLDIKNQLKNGDHQRYHIYVTPLEILIFKMGGQDDYVTQYSDTIFNSIRFKKENTKSIKVTSGYADFQVKMPSLYSFPNRYRKGDRLIQGFDSITDTYYFLRKATLNDFNFIEEDSFELKKIQQRFYKELKLIPTYQKPNANNLISKSVLDSVTKKELHLKTVFNRGDYYLMGCLSKNPEEAVTFFDSFRVNKVDYSKPFKKIRDTALFFTTVTTVKPPKFVENSKMYRNGRHRPKAYEGYTKKTIYQNKNNEAITLELNKSHDLMMYSNIDSVWTYRKKLQTKNGLNILSAKDTLYKDGYYELKMVLTDTASTRGILVKNIVKGGLFYELKAQTDTVLGPTPFVAKFFEYFEPFDTLVGKDILKDKTSTFFAALHANDSIILEGHKFVKFQKKHIDSLKYYISEFKYPEDKKYIQSYLIQQLGKLGDPKVIPFLTDFYVRSYNNSNAQTKILQALAKKVDEESAAVLLELLSKDLPLVSNTLEIHKIFRPYTDSLPLAKKLFPELLDYSAIAEYKPSIFSMLAKLKAKGLIKPKHYKKYRKQILNDAKIQLKRQMGLSGMSIQNNYHKKIRNQSSGVLENYAILLFPFRKEKEVAQFFERLQWVKDRRIRTTFAMLLAQEESPIPQTMLIGLAKNVNSRLLLFNKFKEINKLNVFPKTYKSERYLAESLLFEQRPYLQNQDSVLFVAERTLQYRGKTYSGYYFKTRNNQDYDTNFTMRLVVFEKGKGLTAKPFYKNEGLRIEDTDTEEEAINYATEEFFLKDRKRAQVYRPMGYGGYGYHGY